MLRKCGGMAEARQSSSASSSKCTKGMINLLKILANSFLRQRMEKSSFSCDLKVSICSQLSNVLYRGGGHEWVSSVHTGGGKVIGGGVVSYRKKIFNERFEQVKTEVYPHFPV